MDGAQGDGEFHFQDRANEVGSTTRGPTLENLTKVVDSATSVCILSEGKKDATQDLYHYPIRGMLKGMS